jgi:hypothetical protein
MPEENMQMLYYNEVTGKRNGAVGTAHKHMPLLEALAGQVVI